MRFDQIIANNNESAIFCLTVYSKTLPFLHANQHHISGGQVEVYWRPSYGRSRPV